MKMHILLLATLFALSGVGCFDGALFFKQSGSSSLKNKAAGETQSVTTSVDVAGGETGRIRAGANITQTIAVSDQSSVAGTVVSFPPGTLAIDTDVTIEEGVTVATEGLAAELGIGGNIDSTGTAVSVQPTIATDPLQPYTVSIPLPLSLALTVDDLATLVVVYKVKKVSENKIVAGIVPREELELDGGTIKFSAEYFGVFQPIFTKSVVKNVSPVEVATPIQIKKDVVNLPPIHVTERSPFVVKAGERVEIAGTNFRPTMTLAMGGKKVSELRVASDVSASFSTPNYDGAGAMNLTVDQDGVSQTVSLFYRPNDKDLPLITEPETEVCLGKKYYDAAGIMRTGKRPCDGPDLSTLTPEIIRSGSIVAGVIGTFSPDFPDPANVYNDTVNGISGTLTLPSAVSVRTGNGVFGAAGTSVTPSLGDCAADGAVGCVAVAGFKAADMTNVTAGNIKSGTTIAGVYGGVVPTAPLCTSDGENSCVVDGTTYKAAALTGLAGKILSGQAVAGISGNVTLPGVGDVFTGISYGIGGNGSTGTLTLPAVGDVNSGVAYGVAGTGSTGTLTLPTAGNVLTGSGTFGNPGSVITPTLTLPIAANVKSGSANYGNPGSAITPAYSPDFPAVANVYNDTVDSVSGTLTLPVVGNVYTGIVYGVAGTGSTGTLTVPTAANVRTGNGTFGQAGTAVTPTLADCSVDGGISCVAVAGFKAADMTNVVAAKIKSGVTIAAVVGDYPSATYPLAGADATADLDFATFDAKIKAATNFEWFDSSGTRYANSGDADIVAGNIVNTATIFGTLGTVAAPVAPDPWDVRVGQTINGIAGKLKVACRNSANTAVFDAGVFKNATADNTTDFFTVTAHGYVDTDTVRYTAQTAITGLTATTTTYFVVSSTANTFQLAATSGGAAINFTTNGAGVVVYKWLDGSLDIWDTVNDYNNNGAAFTAAATPAAWTSDNFCGGAGTAASTAVWTDTTSDGTCDAAGDECRFKDKISGLEWSEFQSASAAWGTAMTTCGNLSFGGAGAWRLPTQKELMAAYEHGIYTAPNANWLTKAQMDANYFWTSSTQSATTINAWLVTLSFGNTAGMAKTGIYQALCVR
jgi:hypothetical protein